MNSERSFSARLVREAGPIWSAMVQHPFVQQVARDTIDPAAFDFWVQQDHYFVEQTQRLWAYAASRAPDEEIARGLINAANSLDAELELFRGHARERAIDLQAPPAPVCQGYASFMLHTAAFADFLDLLASVYGAEKAYYDTWSAVKGQAPQGGTYTAWIANWTSPAFAQFVEWLGRSLDRVADGQPPEALARAQAIFLTTTRFEYLFWDMAYRREGWPL